MRRLLLACAALLAAAPVLAQDPPPQGGVRLVLKYDPGARPSLVVVPGAGLDSARAILRRDLDFSDRFESVILPEATGTLAGKPGAFNYDLYRKLGAAYAVELVPVATGRTEVRLHDLAGGKVAAKVEALFGEPASPGFRMNVHRMSDEVVRWITGTPGIAATRFAFVAGGRVHVVDADGAELRTLTPAGATSLSPTWAPDGERLAYTRLQDGRGPIVIQRLSGGPATPVPGTNTGLNITPAFSPDGRLLAYAQSTEQGTNVQVANVADNCCVQRLTVGRFADNLSPTFAPDGTRLAFVSTRAGPAQIYQMGADGTDAELLVPFDLGQDGSSNGPEWSPEGTSVAFHREVSRSPQVFVMSVAGRRVRQLTTSGRNEDPTWAPDGRHVAYISDRSGRRQVWIIDVDTGRTRQLVTPGAARLPSWSRRLK
jgi:TolB protein